MISQFILDLLFPGRCPLCGEIVIPKGNLVCSGCEKKQKRICEPRCFRCGKQLAAEEAEYCPDCCGKPAVYERGMALWNYDETMRHSISEFKYHEKREYAGYYIREMTDEFGDRLRQIGIEAVVPVPIHKKKLRERGFNQAEILAEGIAEYLNVPLITDLLLRTRYTSPLKDLGPSERRRNLKAAFEINRHSRYWKRYFDCVLLVDDIYTTGSTVECCSEVLLQAGIGKIYVLCLCVGNGSQ